MVETGVVKLRAHHLLCLDQFRGLGYSPFFVANFRRVQQELADPETMVEITAGPDGICMACPWLKGRDCGRGEAAARRDRLVLARLGLATGTRMRAAALRAAFAAACPPPVRPALCAGCSWLARGVCHQENRRF
ncbi:MAG: DUF1284 domain-containing protein [Thermoanaerobacterales bacterium]|nr:DUF1284 domain-containing protein [Thermoanaerobacterales bacterium]